MRTAFVLMLMTISLGALGQAIPPDVRADIEYLQSLVRRDPEKDAQSSIRRGQLRFLGVAGFVVYVPGVESGDSTGCIVGLEDVDVIRGTADVVWGEQHSSLIEQATTYAARYNRRVADHRRYRLPAICGTPKPTVETDAGKNGARGSP
jgi:hypothetical protein